MSCDCRCAVGLPHGVVGWSAVCDRGISPSFSLVVLYIYIYHSTMVIIIWLSESNCHFKSICCFDVSHQVSSGAQWLSW